VKFCSSFRIDMRQCTKPSIFNHSDFCSTFSDTVEADA
jgi:hypothetical protein